MISNPLWNETGYKENTEDVEMDLLGHLSFPGRVETSTMMLVLLSHPPHTSSPGTKGPPDLRLSLQFQMETLCSHSSGQDDSGCWWKRQLL